MQVFKLFLKLLYKYKGNILVYLGIFTVVVFSVVIPNTTKNSQPKYENMENNYAIFDYDGSKTSEIFSDYLAEANTCVEIADDSMETIQDELYARNVDCVVKLLPGFGEHIGLDDVSDYMELYTIPGTSTSELFKENINSCMTVVKAYIAAGFNAEDALGYAVNLSYEKTEVSLPDGSDTNEVDELHVFFKYLGWVFITMLISAITPILIVFDRKAVRDRISASAYKFIRFNLEQILGLIVSAFICWSIIMIIAAILLNNDILSTRVLYYGLNAVCLMFVAMSITFLVSKIVKTPQSVSLMANIISLGMAFICGVFVPMELLSDGVIKIAHFLPVYWYVKAITEIDHGSAMDTSQVFIYMGIEILFALAISMVALVVSKSRKKA